MKHIFVYVVMSNGDPFYGIKSGIRREGLGEIVDIALTTKEFDRVSLVEYSERKYIRILYYRSIFANLRDRLFKALVGEEPVVVYFSDEGVWAEYWARLRRDFGRKDLRAVNVQHGLATGSASRFRRVREAANWLSENLFGFPNFGLGSVGRTGPGTFDAYLTYDEETAKLVRLRTNAHGVCAAHLIKADVIEAAAAFALPASGHEVQALFAAQPRIAGSAIRCDFTETLDHLLPLAKAFADAGIRFVVRLHPGMDVARETANFWSHPISKVASLDEERNVYASVMHSAFVLSLYSTVLWEAQLLGKVAVRLRCDCSEWVDLGFETEIIDLSQPLSLQLAELTGLSDRAPALPYRVAAEQEWGALRAWLLEG